MINSIIFFLLSFYFQGVPENDHQKYFEAYEYINECANLKELDKKVCKTERHFPVNVINEIYPLSLLIFNNEIIEEHLYTDKSKYKKINDFMVGYDQESDFEPYVDKELSKLFSNNEKSQLYVAFSKLKNNMLFAEVAYNVQSLEDVKSIKEITSFNSSLAFLFIFDENDKIKKVCTNKNQYN